MKYGPHAVLAVLFVIAATTPAQNLFAISPQTNFGITYASGGIGDDERSEMHAMKNGYTLLLKVAAKSGHYLGDVDVTFRRAGGEIAFESRLDGPWLLVNLPIGAYDMSVTSGGTNQRKKIRIDKGARREVVMYWNVKVED
jgi:hypothetical protein